MKIASLKIERKKISDLIPHPKNPRKHPEKGSPEYETLRSSLKHDYFDPIIWNQRNGKLVAGHLRTKVLTDEGYTHADCSVVDYDEKTHIARMIAANRLQGKDDPNLLKDLFSELDDGAFDLKLSGWDESEIGDLMSQFHIEDEKDSEPQIDKAEELRLKYGVKKGQIWQIGEHRLMCGDSTKGDNVEMLMGGENADFMVTSPPYNVGVKYDGHDDKEVHWEQYRKFLKSVLDQFIAKIKEGRGIAWNIGTSPKTNHVRQHILLEELGLIYYRQMIWKKVGVPVPLWHNTKSNPLARRFTPNYQHEIILIFTKGILELGGPVKVDELCENDVFEFGQQFATTDLPPGKERTGVKSNLTRRSMKAHPAAYPVKIPSMFISHFAAEKEIVIEPFSGSGTTIIACENLKRKCRAMEISPGYVAVALQRWADVTKGTPNLLK